MKKQKARPKQVYMQRLKCDCMAQKHQLINNCLNCGKVVCAQQGQGNCLYCGSLVTRPDGLFLDDTTTYFPSLTPEQQQEVAAQRSKAIQHKNILVERDKAVVQNNIFDQQLDYYEISENKWLDQEDRQHAIDRILEKGNYIQTQQFKTNARFDALTGVFVREEFNFDEEGFKKEGKDYFAQRELDQNVAKEKRAKDRHHFDERLLRSERMRDLCAQIIKPNPKPTQEQKPKIANMKGVTELVMDE